ncbi:MAG: hypothetical protein ACI9OJ_003403, partial [Myxococcota bacterium]
YGILEHCSRLGYQSPRVVLGSSSDGDRFQIWATAEGDDHLLMECVLSRELVTPFDQAEPETVLFCNWMTLRDPVMPFEAGTQALPGQDAPGLGLAREAAEMLGIIARRLNLSGVALRPAWYHVAYVSRHDFHFADPAREGRFRAMIRDLRGPLPMVTCAVAEGQVLLNDVPYIWEPLDMVHWFARPFDDAYFSAVGQESSTSRFAFVDA